MTGYAGKDQTTPKEITGVPASVERVSARDTGEWSFGSTSERTYVPVLHDDDVAPRQAANANGVSTTPPQEINVPNMTPLSAPKEDFGRTSLKPVYEWEGVVEDINGTGFRARLTPLVQNGDPTGTEFTEFDFDDLETEADRPLVREGAVFYWTLGREQNAAGSVKNVSLVRFRRLTASAPESARLAKCEAAELMRQLNGDNR